MPKVSKSIFLERQRFLQLLKAREKPRSQITNKVFDSLVERKKRAPKNIGKSSRDMLFVLESLGIKSDVERRYVLQGLRKAKILFGNKFKDPAYFRDTVDHLRSEFELLKTQKNPESVLKLGMSPFQVLEINEEIKDLPKEYSDLSGTIRGLVLVKKYPDVRRAVQVLRETDSAIIRDLPKEYSDLSCTIRGSVLGKKYPDVRRAVQVLREIDSAIIRDLPKEYSDLSGTIRGSVLVKKYPDVRSLIDPIKKIASFLRGLSLSRGLEIKITQYALALKTKTNTFEDAFNKALKYFVLPLRIISLDAKSQKGIGRSVHELIADPNALNPLELLINKDTASFLQRFILFVGEEKYDRIIEELSETQTIPPWVLDEIEKFRKL